MKYPSLNEEKKLWRKGYKRVVSIDEVGRGALAGPVVAAAVMIRNPKFETLDPKQYQNQKSKSKCSKLFRILNFGNLNFFRISDLGFGTLRFRDSKKLSPKMREKFYELLTTHSDHYEVEWRISKVSEKIIDKINIKKASELAMKRCIQKFKKQKKFKIDYLIVDGISKLNLSIPQKSIVRADEKIFSCAIASIIAKVTRDRIMQKFHKKYPKFGFNNHKGYGTKIHKKMLKKYGPCKIHRKSFRPVVTILNKKIKD